MRYRFKKDGEGLQLRNWHLSKKLKEVREGIMQLSGTGIYRKKNCRGKSSQKKKKKSTWRGPGREGGPVVVDEVREVIGE